MCCNIPLKFFPVFSVNGTFEIETEAETEVEMKRVRRDALCTTSEFITDAATGATIGKLSTPCTQITIGKSSKNILFNQRLHGRLQFFLMWSPLVRRHLFQPTSMVCISFIITEGCKLVLF